MTHKEQVLLTEAHTSMPKNPTRSTKSRTIFLSLVHKLWLAREVILSNSSTSSSSSSSGSSPDKRAEENRRKLVKGNFTVGVFTQAGN